jgi:RNA polymerase sigma-70 factor (ECF subfamily)
MSALKPSPAPETVEDLTDEFVRTAMATTDHYARRIARTLRLPETDIDDLRQDLLLEVLRRGVRFDPARAAWVTFVEMISRHAAADLATRLVQARRTHGGSIDAPVVMPDGSRLSLTEVLSEEDGLAALWNGPVDPFLDVERRIDLERFINALPDHLRRLCRLLQTETPAVAQRLSGASTAAFYRDLQDLRMRLRAVGLG